MFWPHPNTKNTSNKDPNPNSCHDTRMVGGQSNSHLFCGPSSHCCWKLSLASSKRRTTLRSKKRCRFDKLYKYRIVFYTWQLLFFVKWSSFLITQLQQKSTRKCPSWTRLQICMRLIHFQGCTCCFSLNPKHPSWSHSKPSLPMPRSFPKKSWPLQKLLNVTTDAFQRCALFTWFKISSLRVHRYTSVVVGIAGMAVFPTSQDSFSLLAIYFVGDRWRVVFELCWVEEVFLRLRNEHQSSLVFWLWMKNCWNCLF